jgi:hypothetical protein
MALIPLFHVVADEFPVSSDEMIMGSFVKFDTSGNVTNADGTASEWAIGIAGDTKSDSVSGIPSTNGAIIGNKTTKEAFVNRVSDGLTDETKASQLMTVYHSGGKFATDQYDATASYVPGDALYVGADGALQPTSAGSSQIVGRVVKEGDFPSGVPGVDVDGDITLGEYLTFILLV